MNRNFLGFGLGALAAGIACGDLAQALPPAVEHFKPGVKREMALERPDATWGYLHDNAIYAFKDRLFVAWYNCPKDEMIGDSVIRGRWSDDAGKTWSDIKLFVGSKGAKFMYVPPAFGSDGKNLYLFASRMTGPDVLTDCEIFKWDPKTETFGSVGLMGEKFLPNTAMYRRTDGTFMIGGRRWVGKGPQNRPTLAVSETTDPAGKWRFVDLADEKIPGEGIPWGCAEVALSIEGKDITAYVRVQDYKYPDGKGMRVFESADEGATWKMVANPPFRVNPAKPAAGVLSDGRKYLIANAREKDNRRSLIIWIAEKGSKDFTRAFYVQQGDNPAMGLKYEWCYPSTCEYKGELYVVTSTCTDVRVKNSSGLTIIPLWALDGSEVDWKSAKFITVKAPRKPEEPDTTVNVKTYVNEKEVASARWHVTGGGVFRAFVNGQPITDDRLLPGYTTLEQRRDSFAYDVTKLMKTEKGAKNVFCAESVSTWWTRMQPWTLNVKENCFGAVLVVTYADGTRARFPTDLTWQAAFAGPVKEASLFQGEIYDARVKTPWRTEGAPADWANAREFASMWAIGKVTPHIGPAVRFREDLKHGCADHYTWRDSEVEGASDTNVFGKIVKVKGNPLKIGPGEEIVFDFWQNHSAVPEMVWRAPKGVTATLRFAEMLNDGNGERARGNDGPAGSLYLKNLRSAKALVKYTFAGEGDEKYVTENTFFGYRYMSVRADGPLEVISAQAIPVSSVAADAETGTLVTGRADLNKLISNVRWGMLSNYLAVPTDCPQRDERQGWSADTQVFAPAGCYLANVDGFLTKWMQDLTDSIEPATGSFPFVAPFPHTSDNHLGPSTGWSDAGIVVPHVLYRMFGNVDVLKRHFAAMDRFMDVIAKDPIPKKPCPDFGDWLAYEGNGDELRHLISQAYLVWDARMMVDVAKALGRADAVKKYEAMDRKASADFKAKYLGSDGLLVEKCRMQTGYAFAILLDLVEGEAYQQTTEALVKNIADHGGKLQTGFLGTAVLPYALTKAGRVDVAYDILLQRGCPSWLYSVDQGATTIWERWNSYTKDKGFGDAGMNSFNHYAYGSVYAWMVEEAVGLKPDVAQPGFRHFFLAPHPDKRLGFIGMNYRSAAGLIEASWRYGEKDAITYAFRIPEGTTATLTLPGEKSVELKPGVYEYVR